MNLEIRFRLPNQESQTVPVKEKILIGTLLSNDVVLRTPGVEPIHAMIEVQENGDHLITDLGSHSGVKLNGKAIEVESKISIGDVIIIGDIKMDVLTFGASADENFQTATTRAPDASELLEAKKAQQSLGRFAASIRQTREMETDQEDDDASAFYRETGERMEPNEPIHERTEISENIDRSNYSTGYVDRKTNDPSSAGRPERPTSNSTDSERDTESSRDKSNMLFSPRKAVPGGDFLEVVSYWGDTVLDVELFHPSMKGYQVATIGAPPKAHFLSGGNENITNHVLAQVTPGGYKLRLLDDMSARIRKGGKVGDKKGKGQISLGPKDIAHIAHGPLKYFLMFVKPPAVSLPKSRAKDPMFAMLMTAAIVLYLLVVPAIYMTDSKEKDNPDDDIWSIVNLPEKLEPPKPEVEPPKPEQKVAEVQKPPPTPKPPKPQPKPPTPVEPKTPEKPKVVEKPQQPKPVEKPIPKPVQTLAQQKPPEPPKEAPKDEGMVATGAKKPDFKAPGPDRGGPKGLSGGPVGGGKFNPSGGGARKGTSKTDLMGVEGGTPGKASGVNLSKLGLGAGKILGKTGAGAIKTDFRSSAGGVGGGSGSASKTYGLGGPGEGRTLGLAGTGGAANNFGGFGGNGSGEGGSGGLGGAGIGRGFGRRGGSGGRADVVVPPGDPVVSGGLTMQEVQAVIRANLNQIRHCYEQLLQRSPSSSGKIKVSFSIDAGGRVTSTSITESSISDSIMKSCVTGKIQRWKFPNPRGGQSVSVNYPFVFNPL